MKKAVIISVILLLAAGVFGNYLRFGQRMPNRIADFSQIPLELGVYVGQEQRFDEESYEVLKADTTTLRAYSANVGEPFWLFIAYFSSQKYGSQIHSPKHCLPGGGWRIDKMEEYQLNLPDGPRTVNRLIISAGQSKQVMFYWFETRTGIIRGEFGLKWDLMKNSLSLRPTDAAIIRLTIPITPGQTIEEATARATDYFSTFYRSIEKALPFSN